MQEPFTAPANGTSPLITLHKGDGNIIIQNDGDAEIEVLGVLHSRKDADVGILGTVPAMSIREICDGKYYSKVALRNKSSTAISGVVVK